MIDLQQLTGKQRYFVQTLQRQPVVASLRSLCAEHHFDFNFINGFLLSGVLEGYVQWQEHSHQSWSLTPRATATGARLPGVALAEQLLQGIREIGRAHV